MSPRLAHESPYCSLTPSQKFSRRCLNETPTEEAAPGTSNFLQHLAPSYSISTVRDDDDVTEHIPRDPRRRRRRRRSRSKGLSQQRATSTRTLSRQPAFLPSNNAAENYPQKPNGRIVAPTRASPKSRRDRAGGEPKRIWASPSSTLHSFALWLSSSGDPPYDIP